MLKHAVNYYNQLLEDSDLAESSRQALDEGLEEAKLIFGGRRVSPYLRPHFVAETDWLRVTQICETVWNALQKVKDAAVENEEILEELGITEIERELIAIDPKYRLVSPTARLDSFLTEDSYSYVELNGESPAGIAYADSATEIFQNLPVMKRFAERFDVRGFSGRPKMLGVLLDAYTEFLGRKPEKNPVIAIVDLKDLPTQQEFELFKDYFESQGYTSLICSPEELEFDGKNLVFKGVAIDIVYKRLLVNEYLPIMDASPALLDAYRAGVICMVNSFRSKLVHKKAIFAVLTNEKYAHLFNENELSAIKAHIPWTRKFREEKTFYQEQEIDLVEWTRANSSKLVLKPNDDYGGHGIYIGIEQLVDLDPLLFNGKVGSAFTRLSSSELANVSSGGGMVPTFVIREKQNG
ncbi:MAG: hypothetical protein LC778_12615 [Acidobacteria bacterium]|nr:hypothetical protein [Acidobacteriota bacterium]